MRPIKLTGDASSVSGACPAITFEVKNRIVYTSSDTDFVKGRCSDVRNRKEVEVQGMEMSDNRIRADQVKFK